jgi:hypothetical protein
MSRLSDLLPPEEAHVVRTVLRGTRTWCEAHGESPDQAETHAALDATTWVHDLTDGTLVLIAIEPIERPTEQFEQMRLAG